MKKAAEQANAVCKELVGLVVGDFLGLRTTYRDATGKTSGTVTVSGSGTTYRDATGKTVGTKK